ncbi:class I SAM-dependent methyltransferase [Pelagibacteraceae bacterium]|nr:class I SAM-dependent methyltransferase [Pelagibacteraceae bacterium]
MTKLKKFLPTLILIFLQNILLSFRLFKYKKPNFYCSVCKQNSRGYLTGFFPKLTITCQNCHLKSSARLIAHYLKNININNKKILHFAPETQLVKMIKEKGDYQKYLLGDIASSHEVMKVDIENIEFPENYFDLIICSHVLEHVDYIKASKNIRRVLKKNGIALLMFPIIESWNKTYYNENIKNDIDRTLHFLQFDHLQLFGRDIKNHLIDENCVLEQFTPFGEDCVKLGINQGETLFILKKIN